MSDPLGDPLRGAPPHPPPVPPDVNLLDDSAEPTDDTPTVISKPPAVLPMRPEDNGAGLRGRRLAHFELIEPIGVGGMAAVIRARDTQLDRPVALKILPPEMAADPENVRRFHQEARSAARLDHENIARVFFCGEDQRLHFIAFEFVEGDNLRTILERRGRLPVGEALHYMLQVAAGLAHAARRGVVHRDIKPSNIIITPNGRAKLVDMGLARSLEPQHDQGLTQSGVTLGTFDYISPEQALEPRDADVRSDIYSLGCTFYHMLTGTPPVPEGTAAKKLHHHQHVKPSDPRQFVPDLPDEVAVILDRMMAKQPRDRYQTPEQLVHHLYLAARKQGAAAEVPEGVLAVEAALPNPPGGRPVVLAALAALAVVALVFFFDPSAPPRPQPNPGPAAPRPDDLPDAPRTQVAATVPRDDNDGGKPVPAVTPRKPDVPVYRPEKPTARGLYEFLQAHRNEPKVILELDDLDLQPDDQPDLVITNPEVVIRPRTAGRQPTVRDQYRQRLNQEFQASLTVRSRFCTVEGIRFVLDQTGATVPMAALYLQGVERAALDRCEFIQATPAPPGNDRSRMASVLVEAAQSPARLTVSRSCFLGFAELATAAGDGAAGLVFQKVGSGGQDALTRRGPVVVVLSDCALGPHAALLRLERPAGGENGRVTLRHCSLMLGSQSAAFDVADGADADIEAQACLVSRPGDAASSAGMAEGKGAVLVRRASDTGRVAYHGRDNRYHQLDHYLVIANAPEATLERLRDALHRADESRELEASPWGEADPLADLLKLNVRAAFQVDLRQRDLREPRRPANNLIGAERLLAFAYVEPGKALPPVKDDPAAPARRELVVKKVARPDPEQLLYPTLPHALLDARPGDVIRLDLDGDVALEPLQLGRPNLADLTLKPGAGFHPVLTLAGGEGSPAALFEVHNGKLRLEGLEVRLEVGGDGAVVSFVGEGECTLDKCLVTLERPGGKSALAVLPEKRMARKPAQAPRLALKNCFVRGHGDLVSSPAGCAAEVSLDNCLVALSGSLLNAEATEREAPALGFSVSLKHVTTYLGENLLRLRAVRDLRGLAGVQCEASDCLFLPGRDRPFLHLEGPESDESNLRGKLTWVAGGKNAYGSFPTLLEQQSVGEMMKMPSPVNLETWKEFSNETGSEYNVKLPAPPPPEAPWTQLAPSTFRPDGLKEYGADPHAVPAPRRKSDEE